MIFLTFKMNFLFFFSNWIFGFVNFFFAIMISTKSSTMSRNHDILMLFKIELMNEIILMELNRNHEFHPKIISQYLSALINFPLT